MMVTLAANTRPLRFDHAEPDRNGDPCCPFCALHHAGRACTPMRLALDAPDEQVTSDLPVRELLPGVTGADLERLNNDATAANREARTRRLTRLYSADVHARGPKHIRISTGSRWVHFDSPDPNSWMPVTVIRNEGMVYLRRDDGHEYRYSAPSFRRHFRPVDAA